MGAERRQQRRLRLKPGPAGTHPIMRLDLERRVTMEPAQEEESTLWKLQRLSEMSAPEKAEQAYRKGGGQDTVAMLGRLAGKPHMMSGSLKSASLSTRVKRSNGGPNRYLRPRNCLMYVAARLISTSLRRCIAKGTSDKNTLPTLPRFHQRPGIPETDGRNISPV